MIKDDEDWAFPPESVDQNRYRGQGSDLSGPINQGQHINDLRVLASVDPKTLAEEACLSLNELLAI